MTAIKEVGAAAIDSVAGAFGATPPLPGATRSELANEHLFRFRPTHSPKGFMSKHEDFDVTVADDDAGKALCTYLMQHVGPAPSDAPPGSAEEAAAAPVEATDTN